MNVFKNKLICFFVICFFVNQVSSSQTYSEDESVNESIALNSTDVSESFFNSLSNSQTQGQAVVTQGSFVSLVQVGEDNLTKIEVSSQTSNINIIQNGNDNDVNLKYQVKSVFTDLKQNGSNNYILDYAIDPIQDISLDILQNGDNLYFERFGTNEMSKTIQFTQTSASPTIIIRSFK